MRFVLLAFVACSTELSMPDAGSDRNATWPCYFWNGPTKCAPECSNRTLLGRPVWGTDNTCEYLPGRMCEPANMTGPADSGNAGCCVVVGDQVNFYGCM